jgi:RND family efflux transporter MFP subunit
MNAPAPLAQFVSPMDSDVQDSARGRWLRGLLKRPSLIVGPIVAVAAVIALFLWQQQPLKVRLASVRRGEAVAMVYATGFVEPEQPVSLSARVTAPVLWVAPDEGDRVRKGQALIMLDAAEQRGLLAQAQAERRGSELTEQRVTTLYGEGWVTRAAHDEAVATASAARAGESAAAARVAATIVRAPMDGVVLKRDVEPGDLAVPGAVLMELGDPSRARITATVDERDIVGVRPGQEALLSSDSLPGRVMEGRVQSITPGGDPTQRAFRVRLVLAEPVQLPFGMTVEANIITQRHPTALLMPASAYAQGGVWIVDGKGRAHRRLVRTGIVASESVEITGGVEEGERVILSPPEGITEGSRVSPAK